jgi:hypothetical protein
LAVGPLPPAEEEFLRLLRRQELVGIALIHPLPQLAEASWTIMDEPFSNLPFPTANARSLYHVRCSVHARWLEGTADAQPPDHNVLLVNPSRTNGQHMVPNCALTCRRFARHSTPDRGESCAASDPAAHRLTAGPSSSAVGRWPGVYAVLGGTLDNVYDMEPFRAGTLKELSVHDRK